MEVDNETELDIVDETEQPELDLRVVFENNENHCHHQLSNWINDRIVLILELETLKQVSGLLDYDELAIIRFHRSLGHPVNVRGVQQ